jgi:hypothetical protein
MWAKFAHLTYKWLILLWWHHAAVYGAIFYAKPCLKYLEKYLCLMKSGLYHGPNSEVMK